MIEVNPYFAPGERYPSIIGVKADGDEHELAYIRKAEAERMCHVESVLLIEGEYVPADYYEFEMECGGGFNWDDEEPPSYCPNCGAKVR